MHVLGSNSITITPRVLGLEYSMIGKESEKEMIINYKVDAKVVANSGECLSCCLMDQGFPNDYNLA